MARVGEERHGVPEDAVHSLDENEPDVQGDADGEGLAEARRGVAVAGPVGVPAVRVGMVVARVVVPCLVVVFGHLGIRFGVSFADA